MPTMTRPRPTVLRPRRIPLPAGPAAPAQARRQVQAAISAWDLPVDPDVAVLLTSELVTNAVRQQAGQPILLTITGTGGQLRVDVHDTSRARPVPADAPADAEAGRGLMLVARLSAAWGYHQTPAGKAVYFTLAAPATPRDGEHPSPQGDRTWAR